MVTRLGNVGEVTGVLLSLANHTKSDGHVRSGAAGALGRLGSADEATLKENDALYLRLDESEIAESEEVQPGVILDFDSNNNVVGVEILALSTRVKPEMLKIVQLETV
jgi:uncharacterized protein YuzE